LVCLRGHERRYSIEQPGRKAERLRSWRAENKERLIEYGKRSRSKNADSIKASAAGWRMRNPNYHAEWKRTNKERVNAYTRKRRAAIRQSDTSHSAADIERLLRAQRNRCASCKKTLRQFHIDHVRALSRGGTNHRLNIQLLCPSCNCSKGAKDNIAFMQMRGHLL